MRTIRHVHRLLPALAGTLALLVAACGGSSDPAAPSPPAAYFVDGVEYAFEYQLDARGRVDNYRVTRREGTDYASRPEVDLNLFECSGSLQGSYDCRGTAPEATQYPRTMRGESGRLVSFDDWHGPIANQFSASHAHFSYSYDQAGLASVSWNWETASIHRGGSGSQELSYDAGGRLALVREASLSCYYACRSTTAEIPILVDATGRLLRAERVPVTLPAEGLPPGTRSVTTWSYDSRGFMERVEVTHLDDLGVATTYTTRYEADADGWLKSRVTRSENRSGEVTEAVDEYSVLRSGGRVAEERFTQAEPRGFYHQRGPQRVRYSPDRMPSEPLFIPRALTGLEGSDYFGVMSSHDR